MLPALFLCRRKPTTVLDQAAQIIDLTGVAGVAVFTDRPKTKTVPIVPDVQIVPDVLGV